MKLGELSEWRLAGVIAVATLVGGFTSSVLDKVFIDAGTEKQTDVQLVQLAIGLLSERNDEVKIGVDTPETVLREWAVDTINSVADVKFDERAKTLLVDGDAKLAWWGWEAIPLEKPMGVTNPKLKLLPYQAQPPVDPPINSEP